jgi:hypothetical protein
MITAHHPDSAHACVVRAITALVYRIGLRETARMFKMDESNMARRIKRAHLTAWSTFDIMALKKRERDEFGTRDLHEAEERAIYGDEPGAAVSAADHVARGMGLHGDIIALEARILDGGINEGDRADIESLSAKLDRTHEADRLALASLRARLGATAKHRRRA